MNFKELTNDHCMRSAAIDIVSDLCDRVDELYREMYSRSSELPDGLPNVVLAGLTLAWLQYVHNVFGSASYESAVSLLRQIRPEDRAIKADMRHAAHDLLRRSGWNRRAK